MFKNPRRGRQARNFSENDPKILDLKSSSEQIIFRKLSLGAPGKVLAKEQGESWVVLPPKPATQGHNKTLSKAVSQNTDLFVSYSRTRERSENNQNAHMKVELANRIL